MSGVPATLGTRATPTSSSTDSRTNPSDRLSGRVATNGRPGVPQQALGPHEPLDLAAGIGAGSTCSRRACSPGQLLPHPTGPTGLPAGRRRRVDLHDVGQRRLVLGASAERTGNAPCMSRDPEAAAGRVDEADHQECGGSSARAKKLDAANKRSLDRFSSWNCWHSSSALDCLFGGHPGRWPESISATRSTAQDVLVHRYPGTDRQHPRSAAGPTPAHEPRTRAASRFRNSFGDSAGAGTDPSFLRGFRASSNPGALPA